MILLEPAETIQTEPDGPEPRTLGFTEGCLAGVVAAAFLWGVWGWISLFAGGQK